MILNLIITPEAIYLDKERIPDELIPELAYHSQVLDKSQPGKLKIYFKGKLTTPGIFRMPLTILKRLY